MDVGVAQRPVHELANHEERPALAHEVERVRDGAILVVALRHSFTFYSGGLLNCHFKTCETQANPARLDRDRIERDTVTASAQTKWLALALICVVQFMSILDIAIVNVALPSIQKDLGFSQENLQWVISAYALMFGGFLLLGGRLGDRLGRRRLFFAGIVIFTTASLLAGLSWSEEIAHHRA